MFLLDYRLKGIRQQPIWIIDLHALSCQSPPSTNFFVVKNVIFKTLNDLTTFWTVRYLL